jgi:hypothetical protein
VTISSFILETTPYTPTHCTNNRKFHLQRSLCWPDKQIRIILSIDILSIIQIYLIIKLTDFQF